jgi:hypothetical protein
MKYKSKKTICSQGHKHASKKEAFRCDELYSLGKQKLISNLKQQPEFILQSKFMLRGKMIRAITYRADFSYYDNIKKKFVVEDVKGFKTTDYKIKVKMLQFIMKDREDFLFIET